MSHPARFLKGCARLAAFAVCLTGVRAQTPSPGSTRVLNLQQCIDLALQANHLRPASRFAVAMAEAQHRQALAGYWPQVTLKGGYQRLDEPTNFLFPASTFPVPAQTIPVPGGAALVTIPANTFGPGFPPASVQLPVSYLGQTVNTPASAFGIPEQNIRVIDRDLIMGSLDFKWLLFDGGMRSGLRTQTGGLVAMMREDARRTDLEIIDGVKRMYWGAVLARQVHQVGKDTLARMEVTLQLTESVYKEGSGTVTRADYLDNLVMVESLRSMVALLEKNEAMAQAALAGTIGLSWQESVRPASEEIPFEACAGSLQELVSSSYQFNPDWAKLEAAIRAAQGAVTTARSGYLPKVALTGELHRWWNDGFNSGMSTPQNRTGWTAGLGIEFPLFNGFLTQNKVSETLARVHQLKETQFLLREGLGLQIKDLVLSLDAAAKSQQATLRAMQAAAENRELNTRAYQSELVETGDVIKAQLMEALMAAQHYKARYDYVAVLSQLSLVVGTEVHEKLGAKP
ncbi:MAG: TolC family protein [Bryobacteraceae bacterium]